MSLSMKNMLLLLKEHVTAGVDPVPTPGANAMLVRGLMPTIIKSEFEERNLIRAAKGNFGQLAVGVHRAFEFEVELAGAGTAGTAPKWGPALKACGFSQTVSAGVSVTYAPVSSGEPAVAMYGYLDGVLWKMLDAKGTVQFELNAKKIPVLKFRFIGAYQTGTDVAVPGGADFTGFTQPATVGKINTPTFTVMGQALGIQSFSLDVANTLAWRELVNVAGATSPDRKPAGTLVAELGLNAGVNWGEVVRLGSTGVVNIVHGTAAGNIATLNLPKIQVSGEPTLSNDAENAMVSVPFSCMPNTGNDEISLVLT